MKKTLLYIPPLGGGLKDLFQAGQHKRLLEHYCPKWLEYYDQVLIHSQFNEKVEDYEDCASDKRVRVLGNKRKLHRYLAAILFPFLHSKAIQTVTAIRVSQTTGSLTALCYKLYFRFFLGRDVPVFTTYGYDYVLFAKNRGVLATLLAKFHEFLGGLVTDHWITTTEDLAWHLNRILENPIDRIQIIPNGVDQHFLDTGKAKTTTLAKEKIQSLIFVGRLEYQKNLDILIDLCSSTAERLQQPLILNIVGLGSLQKKLKSHRHSQLLTVNLLGGVEHTKLPELLSSNDVFVTSTLFEGHPKAILEAMACGLPVLGRDSTGVGNLLKASNQSTFTDSQSFYEGLVHIQSNYQKVQKDAFLYTSKNFSLSELLTQELNYLKKYPRS